ncbi:hypothetical protein PR202_gb14118 [Eleusine coracana subsp. coracana]|uniref:Uncharacterized protein n=1 Tax=Eleusine coracana subsp. coracana TaxID=191504 RepID=A0AAV5EVU6_ELECO|nr:hypothetical protein PR202_gb14118 [Eleusine coracana subsp. coracana]
MVLRLSSFLLPYKLQFEISSHVKQKQRFCESYNYLLKVALRCVPIDFMGVASEIGITAAVGRPVDVSDRIMVDSTDSREAKDVRR